MLHQRGEREKHSVNKIFQIEKKDKTKIKKRTEQIMHLIHFSSLTFIKALNYIWKIVEMTIAL